MSVDGTRLLRALGILAWAGFFDYLWLSGHATAYVGPRTEWVVTFGAITLSLVAIVYLTGVFTREGTAPTSAEVGRLGIVVAPILLAAMAPAATLGAHAVDQKTSAEGEAALRRISEDVSEFRLYELSAAKSNPEWAAKVGIEPGLGVDFDGFVSKVRRDGTVVVSRFLASCCAADAVPYSIAVELPAGTGFEENEWVQVRGELEDHPREKLIIAADSVEAIDKPLDAYG